MTAGQEAAQDDPELVVLAALREAGWIFRPWVEAGQTLGLAGSFTDRDFTDAVFIADRDDARAVRLLADQPGAKGGVVWDCSGSLREVVAELMALPAPHTRLAPRLVIAKWP
ncbi:hypothetical protein M8C13_33125 [Crossiella sp. SN42]|uniref:hypothetical protein n=1 Tax=Crossiella sp. SN42 TaxID=2944808 RepID=UPI00207D2AD3|nr:hypothetical protein [Crossiella sp. SN42]MCO1580610.1 hypothetical protein [Crossiella sp. SN42]